MTTQAASEYERMPMAENTQTPGHCIRNHMVVPKVGDVQYVRIMKFIGNPVSEFGTPAVRELIRVASKIGDATLDDFSDSCHRPHNEWLRIASQSAGATT